MSKEELGKTPESDTTKTELQNTTAGGTPPRRRVGTALAAKRIYDDLAMQSIDWAKARARIQGVYDGNPPWSSNELTRLGQSHRCNVNFREMEAIIDSNTSAAWALHMDIGPMIDCKIADWYLPSDGSGIEWSEIIAEEYTRTLLRWPGFVYNVDTVTRDCFKYGLGGMAWENEWDWRPKAFAIGNLKISSRAKLDPAKQDLFCLNDEMSIHDLYELTENRAYAEKAGWNVGAIKKVLIRVYRDHSLQQGLEDTDQTSDWESLQSKIRSYDADCAVMDFDAVKIIHLVVKEAMPGVGISHFIFPAESPDENVEFLFSKVGRYKEFRNALWLLPHNYGENGKIKSIKGLGHRSLPHCEFSNRFLCQLFDSGMISSSMILKLTKAADADELQMLRMGAVTVLPSSLEPIQTSFMPRMEGLIGLRNMSKDILLNNTGVYRPRAEISGNQTAFPTAQQVREEAKTKVEFEHNQATFFYLQWEAWHQEVFRRMTNKEYLLSSLPLPGKQEAGEFMLRCMQRGVPPDLLMTPGAVEVYSAKALGMGSTDARLNITNQLVAMKPSMDEKGRKWVDRQWAGARIGAWNVDKCFPKGDSRDSIPGNATSIAVLENNSALDGRAPTVGTDQPHALHVQTHAAVLARYTEAYTKFGAQGLVNLEEAANGFRLLIPHIQEHVQVLMADPTRKQQVESWMGAIQMMAKVGAKVLADFQIQQAAAIEQQMKPQPGMDPEMMLKAKQMEQDYALEVMKQKSLNDMRAQKTEQQMQIRAGQVAEDVKLKAARAAAEIEIKRAQTDADTALKVSKAAADRAAKGE